MSGAGTGAAKGAAKGARIRALVYGDVDLNVIDGSAVFVQTTALAMAEAGFDVTVMLRAPITTDRLVRPLEQHERITVRHPAESELQKRGAIGPARAARLLDELDQKKSFDLVLLRGRKVVDAAVERGCFDGRLWTYLTDVPQSWPELGPLDRDDLAAVARASRYVLCQTHELRGFLESSVPGVAGKAVLFPPTLPPDVPAAAGSASADGVLRLVYTGKFARAWNTLELCGLPKALAERGVKAELHMVGDKVHTELDHPGWEDAMRRALARTPGLVWHGGVSREEALKISSASDVALSWRAPEMDDSLELSTKVVEACGAGLPVVVNPSPVNRTFLGGGYPLYASTWDDLLDVLERAADPLVRAQAAAGGHTAVAPHRFEAHVERIRLLARRAGAERSARARAAGDKGKRPTRVVVAGHDLKFMTSILDRLKATADIDVRIDEWTMRKPVSPKASRENLEWADVVICEWFGANAVWYSQNKRAGQRLLVRLHRVELTGEHLGEADLAKIDAVVCVGEDYAARTRERMGAHADRVVVIPNAVDVDAFDRPKLPEAAHRLGVIGFTPHRKRLDLALDVLRRVREEDPRYSLVLKGRMPWELVWVWRDPAERAHFSAARRRIARDPLLRGAVVVDTSGGDIPAWLRGVGFVLSTSDDESFHLAPAEGAASRAVPVVRDWQGARGIYSDEWVHADVDAMAAAVLAHRDEPDWAEAGDRAHDEIKARYDLDLVADRWAALLTEGR